MARPTYTARLLSKVCISESAQCFHLEFVIDELPDFDLAPGQFLSAVAPDPNGKVQTRAYSIASAANGNQFDLCVNRVEGGFFSNYLIDLNIGDTVQVHGPHGHFVLKSPVTDSIFVATGTGIAPMRGFTQWLFPDQGPDAGLDRSEGKQIWLVYGTRYESEIYYREYFESIAARHSNFHYIATLSRAHEEWSGPRGYVQEHLDAIIEKRSPSGGESPIALASVVQDVVAAEASIPQAQVFDIHTYICGLNNMVAGVRERLTSFGWHKKQIIFERYD
ncbi:ferredoxin--NADP reductase [Acidicapsa ligni]|uniref:ferredoxin--NADP reductase n=1 Tax=Acidicapsa ligni TaxID=542300 RepID=UPI0021E0B3F7|nr:FAD-dependent oxidoreductase [Acidicapsa ligni]